jgi:hypothetical protein
MGRAWQLCPGISDLDFLRDLKCIVDLDAQVANGAFDLGVAEQQLDRSQIPGAPIDQGRLCAANGMRRVLEQIPILSRLGSRGLDPQGDVGAPPVPFSCGSWDARRRSREVKRSET